MPAILPVGAFLNITPSSAKLWDSVSVMITPNHNAKSVDPVFNMELKDWSTSESGHNNNSIYGFMSAFATK